MVLPREFIVFLLTREEYFLYHAEGEKAFQYPIHRYFVSTRPATRELAEQIRNRNRTRGSVEYQKDCPK